VIVAGVKKAWQTIEGVLWENAHSVYLALREPATDIQLARLAKIIPAKLTRDFVQSLKVHDGLRHSYHGQVRLFDFYALLPVASIIAEYTMMCDLQVVCQFPGSQAGADPAIRNDAHWRPGWLPIMDADGDKLILDLDPAPGGTAGQVFKWSNAGSMRLRVLAPSFAEWLAGLAEMLGKRRFRLDEFGSIRLESESGE
jgi:molybdopterin molybdotransferase